MVETQLLNALVTGIVTGSVVALGAIGLSLVYNIAEVPNFAHGELLMLGAYTALFVNEPGSVPLLEVAAADLQVLTTVGMGVLALLGFVATVGVFYLFGGRSAVFGSWIPAEVPPTVGAAGTLLVGGVVTGLVLLGTPTIIGGMLFAIVVLAALSPLQEKVVYSKFRERDVDLATMLIVALGLSFVLRFGTQAIFGGQVREFTVPNVMTVAERTIPLSAAQFFDLFVTGSGVTVHVVNTGVPGQPPTTVTLQTYSWLVVGIVAVGTLLTAGILAWWRRTASASLVGPRLAAVAGGLFSFVVLVVALGRPGTTPEASVYSTRVSLSLMRGLVILIALAMMSILHVLLQQTKLGKAMRATSDNTDLAKVTGIDTDRVMVATWTIAGAYGAVGGVMLGVLFSQITPNMGFFLLLPMFAGVILGGVGSVYGAILGSYVVGLSMDLGIYLFDIEATYRIPIAFVILFVVLLVKPEGIAGGS